MKILDLIVAGGVVAAIATSTIPILFCGLGVVGYGVFKK